MHGILKAFRDAWNGLVYAIRTQRNIKIHLALALITLIVSWVLHISPIEWIIVLFCMGLIIGLECINSSLEELTNIVSPHFDTRAGRVKDLAAGAVLMASIFVFIIGLILFIPKIWILFFPNTHAG
jgi:diacylglycerol kinase